MICIIPARGGSKRIPQKNTRLFDNEPIVTRAIKLAKQIFTTVAVSTDDYYTREIAESLYADYVPRSEYASTDKAELEDVVMEVLEYYGDGFDTACLLLPTGVFSTEKDIMKAIKKVDSGYADLAYSVTEYDHPVQRALAVRGGKVQAAFSMANTQDFEVMYHDAGQFYVFDITAFVQSWKRGIRILQMEAVPIILEPNRCHDIDTLADWAIAEMKWEAMK